MPPSCLRELLNCKPPHRARKNWRMDHHLSSNFCEPCFLQKVLQIYHLHHPALLSWCLFETYRRAQSRHHTIYINFFSYGRPHLSLSRNIIMLDVVGPHLPPGPPPLSPDQSKRRKNCVFRVSFHSKLSRFTARLRVQSRRQSQCMTRFPPCCSG